MEIRKDLVYKTRSGHKAVIYTTDARGDYPIHGAIQADIGDLPWTWMPNGRTNDVDQDVHDIVGEWDDMVEKYLFWGMSKNESITLIFMSQMPALDELEARDLLKKHYGSSEFIRLATELGTFKVKESSR